MEIAVIILNIIVIVMLAILFFRKGNSNESSKDLEELRQQIDDIKRESRESQSELRKEISATMNENMKFLSEQMLANQEHSSTELNKNISILFGAQKEQMNITGKAQSDQIKAIQSGMDQKIADMDRNMLNQLKQLEARLATFDSNIDNKLQGMKLSVDNQLKSIRDDNNRQLDQIRGTVDEKLQKTLETKMNESFKLVSERLEQVYKGLGEMQTVAQGVGDLKKVLSNVKTRGILGEIQLGAILKEILTADQYAENIATVPKSSNRVEFAVRLPGAEDGKIIYLPIDSKFNGDRFAHLQEAYETADPALVSTAKKELVEAIKKCAKDISEKYIEPPYTTQFAIMFLPFEGLYAEVVNTPGLVEELQRTYKINVAGPSTMAAMLNSLKMGFQTLAIQKRSSEVWEVLGAVKTEFESFEKALSETQDRLRKTEDSLEKLVGVRTRQMNRKLSKIDKLDPAETYRILESN